MKKRHIVWAVFAALCMLMLSALTVSADVIDNSRTGTLTVTYEAVGTNFRLYRVADITQKTDGAISFALAGNFADSKVELKDATANSWSEAVSTLAAFVAAQSLQADAQAAIDQNGKAEFKNLSTGLYLVVSDAVQYGGYDYTSTASLVTLPSTDDTRATNNSTWSYDVQMKPKGNKTKTPEPETETETKPQEKHYQVRKVWSGDTSSARPTSIKVKITKKSGSTTTSSTVTLNADNNWTHSWSDTDSRSEYSVDEDPVPTGYTRTVTVSTQTSQKTGEGVTLFTITNKKTTGSGGGGGGSTGGSGSGGGKGSAVKTGDDTNLILPFSLAAVSLIVILGLVTAIVRKKKER